jgi:hypothetical protein
LSISVEYSGTVLSSLPLCFVVITVPDNSWLRALVEVVVMKAPVFGAAVLLVGASWVRDLKEGVAKSTGTYRHSHLLPPN